MVSPLGYNLSRPPRPLQFQHHLLLCSLLSFTALSSLDLCMCFHSLHFISLFSISLLVAFILWLLHPASTERRTHPTSVPVCFCSLYVSVFTFIFTHAPPVMEHSCTLSVFLSFAGSVQGILCEMCQYSCDRFALIWCGLEFILMPCSLSCCSAGTRSPLPLTFPSVLSFKHFLATLEFISFTL